jgi:hypothetical protein
MKATSGEVHGDPLRRDSALMCSRREEPWVSGPMAVEEKGQNAPSIAVDASPLHGPDVHPAWSATHIHMYQVSR